MRRRSLAAGSISEGVRGLSGGLLVSFQISRCTAGGFTAGGFTAWRAADGLANYGAFALYYF